MVAGDDVALLVSNSGATNEILAVIDPLHQLGCRIIAMTGDMQSPLAKRADLVLSVHVDREVCPLGLAPTTSTTATLLMGDALMVRCISPGRRTRKKTAGTRGQPHVTIRTESIYRYAIPGCGLRDERSPSGNDDGL